MTDPFENFRRVQKEFQKMMEEFDTAFGASFGTRALTPKNDKSMERFRSPVTNCYQTENSLVATFELPGVDKDDIELNITDDQIEVKVTKKREAEKKSKDAYSYKSEAKQFYRSMPIPAGVDINTEKIDAKYENGLLKIEMPKRQIEHKKKRIDIK